MTDKERMDRVEEAVWALRAELAAARAQGLDVSVRYGWSNSDERRVFDDLFDTFEVSGTRRRKAAD